MLYTVGLSYPDEQALVPISWKVSWAVVRRLNIARYAVGYGQFNFFNAPGGGPLGAANKELWTNILERMGCLSDLPQLEPGGTVTVEAPVTKNDTVGIKVGNVGDEGSTLLYDVTRATLSTDRVAVAPGPLPIQTAAVQGGLTAQQVTSSTPLMLNPEPPQDVWSNGTISPRITFGGKLPLDETDGSLPPFDTFSVELTCQRPDDKRLRTNWGALW